LDLSPAAIRQARADADRRGISNIRFEQGTSIQGRYDAVIAIFFLHHLLDEDLARLPGLVKDWLLPGGVFYSLDPSRARLSGVVGRLIVPNLMKRYQSQDERELDAEATAALFHGSGFETRTDIYDFGSSPFAGLFPGWRTGYKLARHLDDALLTIEALRKRGSNFEIIAKGNV
jgi:SAM-dependent methyltransferase